MSTRKPVSIGQILDRVGKTSGSRLNDRSRALDRLEHQLDQWLPAELIGRVKVGNFRNNELILFVDSSSWAARLRFVTPQLLQKLRQDGRLQPERIQVRILPLNQDFLSHFKVLNGDRLGWINHHLFDDFFSQSIH